MTFLSIISCYSDIKMTTSLWSRELTLKKLSESLVFFKFKDSAGKSYSLMEYFLMEGKELPHATIIKGEVPI